MQNTFFCLFLSLALKGKMIQHFPKDVFIFGLKDSVYAHID